LEVPAELMIVVLELEPRVMPDCVFEVPMELEIVLLELETM